MVEAWHIDSSGTACVSQLSADLHDEEIRFLKCYLSRKAPSVPD